MIHCPYCGGEMPEDAKSCPRCLSLLVDKGRGPKKSPVFMHPYAALVLIAIFSLGLVVAEGQLSGKPKEKPETKKPAPSAAVDAGDAPIAKRPPSAERSAPAAPAPVKSDEDKWAEYNEIMDYNTSVTQTVTQAKALEGQIDQLRKKADKSSIGEFNEKLREYKFLTSRMRTKNPAVPELRKIHKELANSFRIRQRGYQSFLIYLQSGDVDRLQRANKDFKTADQERDQAMNELDQFITELPEPPAPPTPPVVPETPPEEGADKTEPADGREDAPRRKGREGRGGRGRRDRDEARPPAQPPQQPPAGDDYVEPGVDDGATYIEDGGTYYPQDGDSVYVQGGDSVYDGGTYPEDQYYEGGIPPAPDIPY